VYAPALVAWVGGSGFSFSVSLGRGGVGWFPLGPREVYAPTYRVSERYVTNINITNAVVNRTTIVNVYNNRNVANIVYVHQRTPGAVTVVSHETFVNARPVGRNFVDVPSRVVTAAPIVRDIPAAPERASVYGAGNHNAPHPTGQSINRTVLARQAPPSAPNHFERPQSIEQPQNRIPDRPPNRWQVARPNESSPSRSNARPSQSQDQRPLARTAPPIRPPTASERADMQNKERAWENSRQRNRDERREQRRQ
jgi:hypothetical protein